MNYLEGNLYHGFKLLWNKEVKEINSIAHYFEHQKTGAKLLYLENDDEEKAFSITFKTLPEDDCGTAHILEHSVLQGSKKYPVKSPFDELSKGSFKTYLNAKTGKDFTMYPVASTNEQDFWNLMDVYLDAVFYPKVLENENSFRQEGWRIEIDNIDEDIKLNGVVFNEMKGVFSSATQILVSEIFKVQNPDNCYHFESGGNPEYIPELTYEKFKAFHHKYYHPTNSYIYLYGNMDIGKALKNINDDYLINFEKLEIDSRIIEQPPFSSARELTEFYPIGEKESSENKTYISFNYTIGNIGDRLLNLNFSLLSAILLRYEGSPLKQAILDAGLAEDVQYSYYNSIQQPIFSIVLHKTEANKLNKTSRLIENKLQEIVKKGISLDQIEAALNREIIALREAESSKYPKGLLFMSRALKSWLHVDDPLLYLQYEKIISDIRASLNEHFFDDIIKKYLLDNKHKSAVILLPKPGLQSVKDEALKKNLNQKKEALKGKGLGGLIQANFDFKKWQQTSDKPEDLQKIPQLELSDINKDSRKINYKVIEDNNMKILETQYKGNGLLYLNLHFPANHLRRDEWKWLGLLFWLLKKVNTKNYKYNELAEMININTGGIEFGLFAMNNITNPKMNMFGISLSSKLLYEKTNNLPKILKELLINSLFEDKKRIEQVLKEASSYYDFLITNHGHSVTENRSQSKINKTSAFIDEVHYLTFYRFLKNLLNNFEAKFTKIRENLYSVYGRLFNSNNMLLSISAGDKEKQQMKEQIMELLIELNKKITGTINVDFVPEIKHEALEVPVQIQFNSLSCNLGNEGLKYNGGLKLLSHILRRDFLQTKIRIDGGAYGSLINIDDDNTLSLTSYRDPNLLKTYEAYNLIPDYIRDLSLSEEELMKYKIGTIASLDKPLSPEQYLNHAISNHLSGKTYGYEQKIRDEIFATTVEDLKSFADPLEEAIKNGVRCTLGSESKIEEDKALFDEVIKVFE